MFSNMFVFIICVFLLNAGIDVAKSEYTYRPNVGWIKAHKVIATWDEAFYICHNDGHALLASPITTELVKQMKLIANSTWYFIGTSDTFYPGGNYVSIEGVPLEDMPVSDMFTQLDPRLGACLAMNGEAIRVVSCSGRLPFICYKRQLQNKPLNECGTVDNAYKLVPSTGSCYKVHSEMKTFNESYTTCTDEGGYLVILNDAQEAQIVFRMMASDWEYLTIGMRDLEGNGTWMSVHGEYLEELYNVWEEGAPAANPSYRCGRLQNTGKLSYGLCHFPRPFICEKNPNNLLFGKRLDDEESTAPIIDFKEPDPFIN